MNIQKYISRTETISVHNDQKKGYNENVDALS